MKIKEWLVYTRFIFDLPRFLSSKISPSDAVSITKKRLEDRTDNFLKVFKYFVYANPKSPYLPLLNAAGITFSDIEKLTKEKGIEKTLEFLRDEGVYFSIEEFKGLIPVKRKSLEFNVTPQDFDSSLKIKAQVPKNFKDSRMGGVSTTFGLNFLEEVSAVQVSLFMGANIDEGEDVDTVIWLAQYPSMPGIGAFLIFLKLGKPPIKWFSWNPKGYTLGCFTAWLSIKVSVWLANLFSKGVVFPERGEDIKPERVLEFIKSHNKSKLMIGAYANRIIDLCELAHRQRVSLDKVIFYWTGDQLTVQKKEQIIKTGAKVISTYGFREMGHIAYSCAQMSSVIDNYHLCSDIVALIERKRDVLPGLYARAFLWTGLYLGMSKIMINIESGDAGIIGKAECFCGFSKIGLDITVSNVHSFEKLLSTGAKFYADKIVELAENILPKEFNAGVSDFQFVQEDKSEVVLLYISPRVGNIDQERISYVILNFLRNSPDTKALIPFILPGEKVSIKRQEPLVNHKGNILPFVAFNKNLQAIKY